MMSPDQSNNQRNAAVSANEGTMDPFGWADMDCCVGGGDPRISELVEEARRAGYPVTEHLLPRNSDLEVSRFRPDGLVIE